MPREKLSREPTLPTQHARANFHARRMSQIQRIEFKAQMIVRVYHFVRERIFQMSAIAEMVGA